MEDYATFRRNVIDAAEDEQVTPEPENEERGFAVSSGDEDNLLGGTVWRSRPSDEHLEGERVKEGLARQHHDQHFGVEDPSDGLTDDELWEATPKPWRNS